MQVVKIVQEFFVKKFVKLNLFQLVSVIIPYL
jgi:hypothetical protein